jgi:sugar phosphate permease
VTLSFLSRPDARRWRLAYVLMMTLFIGYLDRMNISLALPLMAEEFGWSDAQLASNGELLFSLFYLGYGLANILLSPAAARLGPRKSLVVIVILWALFTMLGALVSQFLLALAATRVLLGFAEGVHFPMMNMLTKAWFPPQERSRANSIWIAGLFLAVLLSPVMLVPLMQAFGWRVGFWGLGLAGLCLSLPLVLKVVHDRPQADPQITQQELVHIAAGNDGEAECLVQAGDEAADRIRQLFTNPTFVLLLLAGILNNIVSLGLVSWLPSYFVRTRGVAYEDLTWLVSLPFAGSLIGVWVWSNLGDRFSNRALIAGLGYLLAGLFVFVSLTATSLWIVVSFFALSVFMTSAWAAAEFALLQQAVPARTLGADAGFYNGICTLVGGGLGPVIVSAIVGDPAATGAMERLLVVPATCTVLAIILMLAYQRMRY